MECINNIWKCSEISYSEKLARLNTILKIYLSRVIGGFPKNSLVTVDYTVGSKEEGNFASFNLSEKTDDYDSTVPHVTFGVEMGFKEEYFVRASNSIYNCVCTTKSRNGKLIIKLSSSGDGSFVKEVKDDAAKKAAQQERICSILSDIYPEILNRFLQCIDTSYFEPTSDVKIVEYIKEPDNNEEE